MPLARRTLRIACTIICHLSSGTWPWLLTRRVDRLTPCVKRELFNLEIELKLADARAATSFYAYCGDAAYSLPA